MDVEAFFSLEFIDTFALNKQIAHAKFSPYYHRHGEEEVNYGLLWYEGFGLWITIALVIIIIATSLSIVIILIRKKSQTKQKNNRRFNNNGVL